MYGPQAALIAECFTPRLRYSGASIGYQLASIIAGGPAPFIATALLAATGSGYAIAVYILFCAIVSIIATALLPDYTNQDISRGVRLSLIDLADHLAQIDEANRRGPMPLAHSRPPRDDHSRESLWPRLDRVAGEINPFLMIIVVGLLLLNLTCLVGLVVSKLAYHANQPKLPDLNVNPQKAALAQSPRPAPARRYRTANVAADNGFARYSRTRWR